jgi:FemAB-related protein (PEP-CTERM system-associated)
LVDLEDGSLAGFAQFVHIRSILFGNHMISMPYFNYGGICAEHADLEWQILEKAKEIGKNLKVDYIELRQEKNLNINLPHKVHKVSMRLELPSDQDLLWKSFSSKLRNQIKRPQKEGMYSRIGREDELENFYNVFCFNMRDLGTPVYPKDFFKKILMMFQKNTWICTVYYNGNPVASGFLIGFKDRLEIPWASSLRRYNSLSPNMLLYWKCLSFASEMGFREFDFGRSTTGSNTYRFKEQWGAQPFPLYWYYWMHNGKTMPELNPENPRYKFAIGLWKKLPIPITKIIGPMIVKNLP